MSDTARATPARPARQLPAADLRRTLPSIDLFGRTDQAGTIDFAHAQVLASTRFFEGLGCHRAYNEN